MDEMSLAEPSVHSWDDSEMDPRPSSLKKSVATTLSHMLLRGNKASSNRSSPSNFSTPVRSRSASPTDLGGYGARSDPAPKRDNSNHRGRSAPRPRAPHTEGPSHGATDRRPLGGNSGPQRGAVIPATEAANRLLRMHRQATSGTGTANAPSLRKLRQIARKVYHPTDATDTEPTEGELLRGAGPGVLAISREAKANDHPHGLTSPPPPASQSYMLFSPDANLPHVDILARLEPVASPNRDDDLHTGQRYGVLSPPKLLARPNAPAHVHNTTHTVTNTVTNTGTGTSTEAARSTPMQGTPSAQRPTFTRARDKAARYTTKHSH